MALYNLSAPFDPEEIAKLRIRDMVYISGKAFTCRSRLQRYVFDEGNPSPAAALERDLLIHVGPIVLPGDEGYELISFMPTSSIRFEKWGPRSIETWGLQMIVGKTTMGPETMKAMRDLKCVHVTPQGVSPNLWEASIRVTGVELFEELGSIEATWQLELDRLGPFIVDIDTEGNNLFDQLDLVTGENLKKAYAMLDIPEDFQYTKLY